MGMFIGGKSGVTSATLAGAASIGDNDTIVQKLNPGGATRTITVRPQARGRGFIFHNTGTIAASILSIVDKDSAGVVTIGMGECCAVLGTGTGLASIPLNETSAEGGSVSGISATYGVSGSSGSTLTATFDSINAGAGEGRTILAADDQINIDDGTMNLQFDAGVVTETGMVSIDLTPSGAVTLRGGGVSQFGDDVGYVAFDGAGAASTSGITTVDLDCSGALQVNSSAGAISIGNDAVAQAVNIATGAAARVISIGNAASASLALEGGVGSVSVNADVDVDINAPAINLSTQATSIGLIDNSGVALAIKEAAVNYLIISTANGSEKIQLVQNVEMGQIGEVVTGAGISLASGVEIIGVSKVVSAAVAYNTADATIFAVPAGEVWLIEDMWFQTAVSWDGNGAFIVGDATDADGFLTLANASLLTTYDESGGIAGWPTGSRGLDSANRGVYLTTAVTLNKRMLRKAGAYNILLDNTPGTSTVGSGTLYMRYTRIS